MVRPKLNPVIDGDQSAFGNAQEPAIILRKVLHVSLDSHELIVVHETVHGEEEEHYISLPEVDDRERDRLRGYAVLHDCLNVIDWGALGSRNENIAR